MATKKLNKADAAWEVSVEVSIDINELFCRRSSSF